MDGRCKYQYYRAQCACPESQLEDSGRDTTAVVNEAEIHVDCHAHKVHMAAGLAWLTINGFLRWFEFIIRSSSCRYHNEPRADCRMSEENETLISKRRGSEVSMCKHWSFHSCVSSCNRHLIVPGTISKININPNRDVDVEDNGEPPKIRIRQLTPTQYGAS